MDFREVCLSKEQLTFKHYCDDAVLEIYLDHKFQWPQEGLTHMFNSYAFMDFNKVQP